MEEYHVPVMAKEAIEHLKVKKGGKYIDATLGDGGHTIEILRLGGKVLGIDQDPISIKRATERIGKERLSDNFSSYQGNFKGVDQIALVSNFSSVDGILYDIGTSFYQLEEEDRGFSFQSTKVLDMRMDPSLKVSAKDLVNALSEKELEKLIFEYGGETFARRIAKAIVNARKVRAIEKCSDLADVISAVKPHGKSKLHPATKTFQALRIAINNELDNFDISLSRAASPLIPGGRLVIITFHSLEDKISKKVRPSLKKVFKKPLLPSVEEIKVNPRSRSAKMRVYEKI